MRRAQGFTLLELTVALLIGAVVVLVVVGVYGTGIRQLADHQNQASLIDAWSYELPDVGENLRLAGLGMPDRAVLVQGNQPQITYQTAHFPAQWLSQTGGPSQVALPSDQLTISYVAPMDLWDCEGNLVLGPRQVRLKNGQVQAVDGQVVIERYFLTKKSGKLSLVCDAMRYVTQDIDRDGTRNRTNINAAHRNAIIDQDSGNKYGHVSKKNQLRNREPSGEVIMSNVDGFWVRLGVYQEAQLRFVSLAEYQSHFQNLPVVALKIAILHHAPLAGRTLTKSEFLVFGQTVGLPMNDERPRVLSMVDVGLKNPQRTQGLP